MEKENIGALSFVLDVGPDAVKIAKRFIEKILEKKMKEKSRDEVCLVQFGAAGTVSPTADVESHTNITIARPLGTVDMDFVQHIEASSGSGNCLDAVMKAMDHVNEAIQGENKEFASKKLFLLTDLGREYTDDKIDAVVEGIEKSETKLVVIYLYRDKTFEVWEKKLFLHRMLEEVNGSYYSFSVEDERASYHSGLKICWKIHPGDKSTNVGAFPGLDDFINFFLDCEKEESEGKPHQIVLDYLLPKYFCDLDVKKVLKYIQENNILDDLTLRDISEEKADNEVKKLITQIGRRDKDTYEKFKECLDKAEQTHLKHLLELYEEGDSPMRTDMQEWISKHDKSNIPKEEALTFVQGVEEQNVEQPIDKDNDKEPIIDVEELFAGAQSEAAPPMQGSLSVDEALLEVVRNNNINKIKDIIQSEEIPSLEITERAIKEHEYNEGVKCLLREMSEMLRKNIHNAEDAWCGYRPCKPGTPVFVVHLSQDVDRSEQPILRKFVGYEIVFRQKHVPNEEEEKNASKEEKLVQKDEISQIDSCIAQHINKLMEEHSNLSIIRPSSIKIRGFTSTDVHVEKKRCIVFNVPVKGIIPVGEKEFPKELDGIATDIREGEFVYCVRHNAQEFQGKLTMGCAISVPCNVGSVQWGTLGGFVDLSESNVGLITSSHVVLTDEEMSNFQTSDSDEYNSKLKNGTNKIQVYQPTPPAVIGGIYQISITQGDVSNSSVEAAIIKITDEQRKPDSGKFPAGDFESIGFDESNPMLFNSGEIEEDISSVNGQLVIKYGAFSGITLGKIDIQKIFARQVKMSRENPYPILYKQIKVKSSDESTAFSVKGDSGALVFLCIEGNIHNLKVIGMITGVNTNLGPAGASFVTPMLDIFKELDLEPRKLKCF